MRLAVRSIWGAALAGLTACGGGTGGSGLPTDPGTPPAVGYVFDLPSDFPQPNVPATNPMSAVKVEVGRRLFYDARLSSTGRASCASCHRQSLAFTDARPLAIGATGEVHPRSSMSLVNMAYAPSFNWANPVVRTLEEQALTPLFGEEPVELGNAGREAQLLELFRTDPDYRDRFRSAFPGETDPYTIANLAKALAAFQRSLISGNSPYDRFKRGDRTAIGDAAKLGEALFFSERLECFHCHGSFTFTGTSDHAGKPFAEREFFNTGLYNIGGTGSYPAQNRGLIEFTGRAEDMGKFKSPSLRNAAVTAPYFHDGSAATLDDVLDHYMAGGRTIASGPNAGDGSRNPFKNGFVNGFTLTPTEREGLLAFLRALTDSTFLTDARHANPWPAGHPARGAP